MNKQVIRQLAKNIRLNRTLKDILILNNSIKKNLFSYYVWIPEIHDIPLNYAVTPNKIYKF